MNEQEIEIPGFRVESCGSEMKASEPLPDENAGRQGDAAEAEAVPAPEEIVIPGFRVEAREEKKVIIDGGEVSLSASADIVSDEADDIPDETPDASDTIPDETPDASDTIPDETPDASDTIPDETPDASDTIPDEMDNVVQSKMRDDRGPHGSHAGWDRGEDHSGNDTAENGESGSIPETPSQVIGVRFRSAGKVYYFSPGPWKIRRGMHVIVETARGLEYGTVAGNPLVVTKKQFSKPLRTVIRVATPQDDARNAGNREKEREAYRIAREKIEKHGLEMKLVSAEYTFDGSKIMFYFTADGRIDFRDLVKDLASVFRTRIELRQIGVRDETRMLGGYGPCGRPLCCATYLNDFIPVSIRMAKEQNLSLNPGKISGVCGRLMCCLKNEEETYEDLNRNLPGIGDEVRGADGFVGEVESVSVLRQRIRILCDVDDEKELHEYGVGEFEILRKRRRGDRRHKLTEDRDGAGQNRGGRKPLSTVAAAVAARQKQEEAERQNQEAAPDRPQARSDRAVRAGRPERNVTAVMSRPDRPDRPERSGGAGRMDRTDRQDRQDRPERSGAAGRMDRPDRADHQDRPARPDRPDRGSRPARQDRPERSGGRRDGRAYDGQRTEQQEMSAQETNPQRRDADRAGAPQQGNPDGKGERPHHGRNHRRGRGGRADGEGTSGKTGRAD